MVFGILNWSQDNNIIKNNKVLRQYMLYMSYLISMILYLSVNIIMVSSFKYKVRIFKY